MKNSSMLIILAIVAAIFLIFVYTNTSNNTISPGTVNVGSINLQSTGSYYTINSKGWSGDLDVWGPAGANVHFWSSNGYDFGSDNIPGSGRLQTSFFAADTLKVTVSKNGYQPITFNLKIPGAGKPLCWPWDVECQQSVPQYNTITVFLAKEGGGTPPTTTLTIKTTPYGCDVRLTGTGYDTSEDSGTMGAKFSNLPSGTYTATITKSGYLSKTVTVPSNSGTYSYNLQETTSTYILTNPNAFVQVNNNNNWLTATADQDGRTSFDVTPGKHNVVISKSGYYSGYFNIDVVAGEDNQFVLTIGSASAPKSLYVSTNYFADIEVVGVGTEHNVLSATFFNLNEGDYQIIATSLCSEESIERIISFPDERYINIDFPQCKPKGRPEDISYKLTVMSNPPDCTANPEWYSEQNTGTEGASWYLKSGTYDIIVKKDGYDTKTEQVTINNEDNLIIVNLETSKETIPPTVTLTAPTSAGRNELVTFTARGDREMLYYNFDFGDGKSSGWTRTYVISHYYKDTGDYTVSVQAKTMKGLLGGTDTEKISIDQVWQEFVPYIDAQDVTANVIGTVTVTLPTNLDIDNYYIQAYIRTAKGTYLIPRWTTLETNFTYGNIIGTFQFRCNETGKLKMGAQGIAMDPLNYKDTDEVSIIIECLPTGVTSTDMQTDTGEEGGNGVFTVSEDDFVAQYFMSIGIVVLLCIIVIIILVVLIVRLKKRRHY